MVRVIDTRMINADRKPEFRWFRRMEFIDRTPAPSWSGHFWHYWIVVTLPKIRRNK